MTGLFFTVHQLYHLHHHDDDDSSQFYPDNITYTDRSLLFCNATTMMVLENDIHLDEQRKQHLKPQE